ncbi:MAG: UDP-N-acetylmuramoyl-L-alanine--D-glutamate ligase, partial [Lachnospiraceae bacterium]|nr:UDP-N-acetylmuramoyl-L-alanine--D-glutamate ligase [Lachnospiraceae bacterium]
MILEDKKILVVGSGKSGIAAVELLKSRGFEPKLIDSNENLDIDKLKNDNPVLKDVEIIKGEITKELKDETTCLILSPGVPTDLPWINELRDNKCLIIGEIELAYHFGKGAVIGITGTNGKTTTTTLVGEIMKAYYNNVDVVGNIGIPYT